MNRLWPLLLVLLALAASSCSNDLPVQPTPDRIEDYFDAVSDEPPADYSYFDECDWIIPGDIFYEQVYFQFASVRAAIPKSLIERGSDDSVANGEIVDVYLACSEDLLIINILTEDAAYQYNDFFGEIDLSPAEAQQIRNDLFEFVPKRPRG